MEITFKLRSPQKLDMIPGYAALLDLLRAIEPAYPVDGWFRCPDGPDDAVHPARSVLDADYLRSVVQDMVSRRDEAPYLGEGFYASLTTARTSADHLKPGAAFLSFTPEYGEIRLSVRSGGASTDTPRWAWLRDLMLRVIRVTPIAFAATNTTATPRASGAPGYDAYNVDYRVYEHREYLGWMGFTEGLFGSVAIPEAAEVIPMADQGGTFIVSVADEFDIHNPKHIEAAHRVEMRLVDLDALPVIDSRYM